MSENPFQYAGRENDGTGLYYNRARYYNPAASRFVSQDPLGQAANGPNLYRYVENQPTNATDPEGTTLQPAPPGLGPSGGVGVGPGGTGTGPGGPGGMGTPPGGPAGPGGPPGSGFGSGPSSGCSGAGAAKGEAFTEAVRCRNYEAIEHLEESNRREDEAEQSKLAIEKLGVVGIACGVGGAPVALATRGAYGGPEAAAAGATFCAGYSAGDLIVRPVLHDIWPSVIEE